jgi:cyclopropane fatty-acyl-phospholipid synthase-like methyltransferase
MTNLLFSAPADRNRAPILQVLKRWLPDSGSVLEVASGTGQHVEYFARACPGLRWYPSDPDAQQRASIDARISASGLDNIEDAIDLDVRRTWPTLTVDSLIVANMLHISTQDTLPALCRGAATAIRPGGILHIYGPFKLAKQGGQHTSVSNSDFDRSLRDRNPEWGIRELEKVIEEAAEWGFTLRQVVDMPANNFSIVFDR